MRALLFLSGLGWALLIVFDLSLLLTARCWIDPWMSGAGDLRCSRALNTEN